MAGIIDRVRGAVAALAGREPETQVRTVWRGGQKANPFVWPQWRENDISPVWDMTTYEKFIEHGFNGNALIYAAIMYGARAISFAPARAYVGDQMRPQLAPPNHPLARLLASPNMHQSYTEYMTQRIVYLKVAGDAFTYLDRDGGSNGLPGSLYGLRPDRVQIVPKDGTIFGYRYKPEGKANREAMAILPQDMIHVKMVNPGDPLEGMGNGLSPIFAMAKSGDVDNSVTNFLKNFFDRGVMLPGILKFKMPLTEEQAQQARARWKQRYGGSDNWAREIGVLDEGADYQQLGLNFKDMEFTTLDHRNEARILMALAVPPIIVGSLVGLMRSTFSNFAEARTAYWQDVMLPELHWFEKEDQRYLTTPDGAFIKFDTSRVPALKPKQTPLEAAQAARTFWEMGWDPVQAAQMAGLDPDVPSNVNVPRPTERVGGVPVARAGVNPPSQKENKEARLFSKEDKERIWKAVDDIAVESENAFADGARSRFEWERREALALVGEMKAAYLRRKEGPIRWSEMEPDIDKMLEESGEEWRETFYPLVEGVVNDAGEFWSAELGIDFTVRNWRGEEWFDSYMLTFADPIGNTSRDELHELLARGQREGWSVDEMNRAIETMFKEWMDGGISEADRAFVGVRMTAARIEMIARTETMRASNKGAFELGKEWGDGESEKEWLSTMDGRTRDSHKAADGQRVKMDDSFTVGGRLMEHPGDTSQGAPVGEIVNCRCTILLHI